MTMTMRQRIESEMEPTGVYATIVSVLHAEGSKPITKRLREKIHAALVAAIGPGDYDIRIARAYGMTNVEYGGYARSGGNRGGSILIAYSEKSVPIAERFLDDMTRYLSAKHERNSQRLALLDSAIPEEVDQYVEEIRRATKAIDDLQENEAWCDVGKTVRQLIEEILS